MISWLAGSISEPCFSKHTVIPYDGVAIKIGWSLTGNLPTRNCSGSWLSSWEYDILAAHFICNIGMVACVHWNSLRSGCSGLAYNAEHFLVFSERQWLAVSVISFHYTFFLDSDLWLLVINEACVHLKASLETRILPDARVT